MQPIIRVENLSKQYRIGRRQPDRTLRETMSDMASAPFRRLGSVLRPSNGRNGNDDDTIWALKDVSFDVMPGEVVGIIGRNGAGKSTLLKILSRITEPTSGGIDLHGRVGSLLEVGTGFHPELTGRENIYLNGAILGMRRAEIERKFDEIVAFAEIEKFLDTPVKHYSSGMYVRLAFAVAAHLEPEILIVDEVLAVGDWTFQRKCLGKMGQVAGEGRTVLFVSHDMRAIKSLCSEAIHLEAGRMQTKADVQSAVGSYLSKVNVSQASLPLTDGALTIHGFGVHQNGARNSHIDGSVPFDIRINFGLSVDITLFRLGVYLKTQTGETVFRSFIADWNPEMENVSAGNYEVALRFPEKLLMPGNYLVSLHASRYGVRSYFLEREVQELITVSAPLGFNSAHLGEVFDSIVIVKDQWQIKDLSPYA